MGGRKLQNMQHGRGGEGEKKNNYYRTVFAVATTMDEGETSLTLLGSRWVWGGLSGRLGSDNARGAGRGDGGGDSRHVG